MSDTETRGTEAFDAAERGMWAGRAEVYAGSFARLCAHPVGALLDAGAVGAGALVLDAGTGTGAVALAALGRGARVVGVDADAGMVRVARGRGVDARVAVLPKLPFPDGEFDAVVANFVLNHIGRPRAALAEARRVLRSGGRVAVSVWGGGPNVGMELLGRACEAAGAVAPEYLPRLDPGEDFERTADGLADLLTEAGFTEARGYEVRWEHRAGVDEWWSGAAAGIGNVGRVIGAQAPEVVVGIRREYERLGAELLDGDGQLVLPSTALLASGAVS
ncbi:class I SAM-dependent methyltransferase [Streptomyces sp. NPDC005648]|uniref:class I SAM-dependent methyltransferase n=1 Tax=Streptomyces sp. NPDC005648 TaxID=3157044 RepID=UPI0033BC6CFB